MSTDFLALRLSCFHIRQHGRQILSFKLHVDGRKFHYRRPQVVHRWVRGSKYIFRATIFVSFYV